MQLRTNWARIGVIAAASTLTGLALAQPAAALEFGELAVIPRSEGRADLFGIDAAEHSVWHMWPTDPSEPWSGPEPLGGGVADIAPVELREDRFEVFAAGSDTGIWRNTQDFDTWAWLGWERISGEAKRVAAAKTAEGTVALFYVGTDDSIWYGTRAADATAFGDWTSLGFTAKDVAVTAAPSGGFDLYAIGADDSTSVARIDPGSAEPPVWVNLGGRARSLSAIHASSGVDVVAVIGFDNAVWLQQRAAEGWSGWYAPGGGGKRAELAEISGELTLLTLSPAAVVSRSIAGPEGWSAWTRVVEASPLESRFRGTARLAIPEQDVEDDRDIELGIRFDVTRRQVALTSFPAITTEPFDTPFGSSRSTVTLVSSGQGRFDPESGSLQIPVVLQFDQSLNVPLINEDARAAFDLSTGGPGGEAYDRESGGLALGDSASFDGIGGGVNPLDGLEVRIVIDGVLEPAP